uniref:Pleckstrin homology domain containing, family A member 7b n=1 Tax=Pygocentrus nattereri TaxID=42514 RepID=A0AAR2J3A9_PYGNA
IMAAPLGRDTLPEHWSYGVCRDGRVFFINDKTRSTTWLHPRTGEPVNSGHMIRSDLPRGWEEGFTDEGASYFINHNQRSTAFRHPVTGQISPENTDFILQEQSNSRMSKPPPEPGPPSMVSESLTAVTSTTVDTTSGVKSVKPSGKVHSFGKRDHAIKRNPNVPVVVRGWLYKQDSSGMRLWKRKWFVLSDYCLFYYKGESRLSRLTVPLSPSLSLSVLPNLALLQANHTGMRSYIYSKNSVIGSQAEHGGMRTYFFSADTQEDMNGWIRAMNQAALMQSHSLKREVPKAEQQAVPQINHVSGSSKSSSQAEGLHQGGWGEVADGEVVRQEREVEVRHGYSKDGSEAQVKASFPDAEVDGLSPDFGAPSRASSALPPQRNGLHPDQNGNVVYKRGLVPRTDTEKQVQRKTALAQVEHWVKAQKGDPKRSYTLPRRTPPPQPKLGVMEAYQSLPKTARRPSGGSPPVTRNLPSDYKYAHDRLSHFCMSTDERMATKEGMVWQLYEWQQRQQFRHGSPTAPVFTGPDYLDTAAAFRVTLEVPRSISVPPSPCDIPPPGHPTKLLSPRRPHTPADRVTVRPLDEISSVVDAPGPGSPRRVVSKVRFHTKYNNSSHIERRSMPSMGYITHTVSAPSLHGKTADDTYLQLKKDLEYLDLKVTGRDVLKDRPPRPVKIAESDVDVSCALSSTLLFSPDKLESVLDVSHQQMEQYCDQPSHAEKIAYQQRLLQEDVVHIRADISKVSTEMENAWSEYSRLEADVEWLRSALQEQMNRSSFSQQEKAQLRKELWRIEDVMAGLSSNKANYKVTINSVQNPGENGAIPAITPMQWTHHRGTKAISPTYHTNPHPFPHPNPGPNPNPNRWFVNNAEEDAPPRPPLPHLYSPDEHPPAVPPLPKEASVIRHTSVRGLKRQSDERKRDRETGHFTNGDNKVELRTFLSEPELLGVGGQMGGSGHDGGYQTLPSRGLSGSSSRLNQSMSISSYVTLRRGSTMSSLKERPKSALERLYSGEPVHQRGRMSAEEQLERMKRHQKALVRERKRTLSQGERQTSSSRPASSSSRPISADLGSWRREQEFDLQLLERAVQGEERPPEHKERQRSHSDEWLTLHSTPLRELDLEPLDYQLDLSKELSKPEKVAIPERYVDFEPEEPLSPQEMEARTRKVERIKNILAKSSVQNMPPAVVVDKPVLSDLDSALQEQERIITMSYALASEASVKSKQVAGNQRTRPPPRPHPVAVL